ncbi:MAG: rod shape-determining protein MreD [Vicinamibacterales bacterium]
MTALRLALALILTLAVQTSLAHAATGNRATVDLVLVLVVFVALRHGTVAGLLFGSVAGLCQDALSGGIIGVGGLAKSLVGACVGALATQFIITNPVPRFLVFLGATIVHAACFVGIYALIEPPTGGRIWSVVLPQALVNAGLGLMMFAAVERLPEALSRRRLRRTHLRTRREA